MRLNIFSCVFWPSVCLLWRSVCFRSPAHFFLIGLFVFLILSCMSCLYTLEFNPLSVVLLVIIFSHSEGCLFKVAHCSLCCAKAFKFNQVPFVYFWFYFHYSRRWTKEDLAVIYVRVYCLCFPLRAL